MVSRVFAGAARPDQPKLKSIKLCLRDCCSDVGKQSKSNDRRCANMLSRSKPVVSASAGASFEIRPLRVTTLLHRGPSRQSPRREARNG